MGDRDEDGPDVNKKEEAINPSNPVNYIKRWLKFYRLHRSLL